MSLGGRWERGLRGRNRSSLYLVYSKLLWILSFFVLNMLCYENLKTDEALCMINCIWQKISNFIQMKKFPSQDSRWKYYFADILSIFFANSLSETQCGDFRLSGMEMTSFNEINKSSWIQILQPDKTLKLGFILWAIKYPGLLWIILLFYSSIV